MRIRFWIFGLWILLSASPLWAQTRPESVIIGPWIAAPRAEYGGQLIYYFDLIRNDTGYMTIVNNGPQRVNLHIQILGSDCYEMFNFSIAVESRCNRYFDLRKFALNATGATTDFLDTKGLIFVTPTRTGYGGSQPAIAYNHLSGSIVLADSRKGNSYGFNAVSRKAISFSGVPIGPPWTEEMVLNGTEGLFEIFYPKKLSIDRFFALNTVSDSRLVLISFLDSYSSAYSVIPNEDGRLSVFAGMEECGLFSLPNLLYSCFTERSLEQILGATSGYYLQHSGRLDLTPIRPEILQEEGFLPTANLFGFQFETLGPYTSARPIWAEPYRLGIPFQGIGAQKTTP